mmetsp:Transcript_90615/g.194301  ORF Transcript_90615/g.194301 Transcript_90615/m.194301 type:complete len:272 (-) Transcript_90615:92-907(-)
MHLDACVAIVARLAAVLAGAVPTVFAAPEAVAPGRGWSGQGDAIHAVLGEAIVEGLHDKGFALVPAGSGLGDVELQGLLRPFGEPYHEATPVMEVRPDPQAKFVANMQTGLEFHHECAYMPQPPRLLALYCRKNAAGGGNLLLCDADKVMAGLNSSTMEALRSTLFVNTNTPQASPMPLLRPMPLLQGRERFIFSAIGMSSGNCYFRPALGFEDVGARLLAELKIRFEHCPEPETIAWHPGDLLVLDNLRIMHGRREIHGSERELAHLRIK